MIILAYITVFIMGILLGLFGGGGSILTLPILVYMLHLSSSKATTYSLFVVGVSAFIGALGYIRKQLISWKALFFFGLPSLAATYFMRVKVMPAFPESISILGIIFSKDVFILFLFAALMILASVFMIRPPKVIRKDDYSEARRFRYVLIFISGGLIGTIVGFLGAGGGFIIIPALVILANLPMKKAVGTSLGLIFINCTIGFGGDIIKCNQPDWNLLLAFSGVAVTGILFGLWLSKYISGAILKNIFGWVILVLGISIIAFEAYKLNSSSL
ncbi:MAG: sulfite exporter TauE/SafE family protein [Bacteroidetes bacterium]|nr:sulfite exporter TauE/SafE family protein [Bacteroidota bacterium]